MRVAFLHTGAIIIPVTAALTTRLMPGVEVLNLLDDRMVADLAAGGVAADSVPVRLAHLARTAKDAGAQAMMLTCSSISRFAAPISKEVGLPILRIDEAMADSAVMTGARIAVVATLATTQVPTAELLRERANLVGLTPEIIEIVVPGAFEAAVSGDRARHDALVVAAIEEVATRADVVVLAQASMASAAQKARVSVPVLASPDLGVARLAEHLEPHMLSTEGAP